LANSAPFKKQYPSVKNCLMRFHGTSLIPSTNFSQLLLWSTV
jgi:hypothetical protein